MTTVRRLSIARVEAHEEFTIVRGSDESFADRSRVPGPDRVGTAAAQPTTQTFSFTGGAQSFTVPENVCQITVDAFGAEGGDGGDGAGGRARRACHGEW